MMTATLLRGARLRLLPVLTAGTALYLLPALATAQNVAVPDHVPSNVKAFISINDTNDMWKNFSQTPFVAQMRELMASPGIANEPGMQQFKVETDAAAQELGFSLKPDQFLGEVLKGFDFYVVDNPTTGQQSVVTLMKFDTAEHAKSLQNYLLTKASEGMAEGAITTMDVEGTEVSSLAAVNMFSATKGDVLLLTNASDVVGDVLASDGEGRLEGEVSEAFDNVDLDGQVNFFVSRDLMQSLSAMRPEMQGLEGNLDTIAGRVNFSPNRIDAVSFTPYEVSAMSPALQELVGEPASKHEDVLAFSKPDALMTVTTNLLQGQKLYNAILEQAEKTGQIDAATIEAQMQQFEAETGLSLKEQVLPAFGPEGGFYINGLNGMQVELVMVAKVADEEKAKAVLSKLEETVLAEAVSTAEAQGLTAPAVLESSYAGNSVRTIKLPPQGIPMEMGLSYTITPEGFALLSVNETSLRSALDAGKAGQGLMANYRFQQAAETIDASNHVMTTLNLGQLVGNMRGMAQMFLGGMDPQDAQSANEAMDVLQSLGGMFWSATYGNDGRVTKMAIVM